MQAALWQEGKQSSFEKKKGFQELSKKVATVARKKEFLVSVPGTWRTEGRSSSFHGRRKRRRGEEPPVKCKRGNAQREVCYRQGRLRKPAVGKKRRGGNGGGGRGAGADEEKEERSKVQGVVRRKTGRGW